MDIYFVKAKIYLSVFLVLLVVTLLSLFDQIDKKNCY